MRRHPQRSSNALQINIVHAFCAGGPRSPKTIGIWNRSRSPRETFDCHKYSCTCQRNLFLAAAQTRIRVLIDTLDFRRYLDFTPAYWSLGEP